MERVLCVCYNDTCRAPMMAAILQRLIDEIGSDITVENAGISQDAARANPARGHSITCMRRWGYDLHTHRSRWIGSFDLETYDLIICVSEKGAETAITFGAYEEQVEIILIPDLWGKRLKAHEACALIIEEAMGRVIGELFLDYV